MKCHQVGFSSFANDNKYAILGPSQNQGQEALGRDPVIPEDEPMLNGEGLTNEEATPGEPHEEESANIRFETPERNDIEFIETIRIHPEHGTCSQKITN
ncbi:hypothetical protein L596_005942 [Steinernema carpocapsae]|uniref:Uncharacterized protein n=1 Tax=Steinernema carpocapsae TaxID=34508 RepID=A0A4U8V226_STECR|nr:hypothetical protein L596_005942 [Steinernema carpocapsae]